VPRIKRDDGRVKMILPPFAGELNGFTLLFEAFIIKFCKHMLVHNVCQLMNVSDYKVWKLFERTTLIIGADLFKQPAVQLSEAKNLLQDFAHIPRAQRLLKVIGKELGK
jgi:hypothetical protein